ncbi:MAG: peptidase M35 [Undibacterium sp.]|nr:peptidase M35 [Undibacterium sp.]
MNSLTKFWKVAVPVALLTAASASYTLPSSTNLNVRLSAANLISKGDVDVAVNVHVTNNERQAVKVLKWQLPNADMDSPLFSVTRDGQPVNYLGRLAKRVQPQESDYIKIEAGATVSYQVELTGQYDLEKNGRYAVRYIGLESHPNSTVSALTNADAPLYLWLEGRSAQAPIAPAQTNQGLAASITYTGGCTASQKSSLVSAVTAATNYAQSSKTYLSATPSATPRFTTWFGTYSATNWGTIKTHFTNEVSAFTTKPLTLDCSCTTAGTYAYVYPNSPYKIYLCGAFWSAPMTGTDSKGGTLVHEMSHFTVVAGTGDYAYGQSAAKSLAISNPTKARMNADSHEYFAENTPAKP